MNTPPGPPPNKPQQESTGSTFKPTVSSGVQGRKGKNLGILTLSMFAAGIVLVAFGGYEIKGSRESGNWPSAQGTISSSSVSKRTTRDSNNRTKKTYYPKVGYHYQVDGRKYISHRIAFGTGETGGSEKWARKIVNKYPVGKTVTVYYNPQDPNYGVLESGFTWRSVIIFLSGILFFVVGVFCLRAYLKNRR
jgi:Protein of unknown function (DUF3592)